MYNGNVQQNAMRSILKGSSHLSPVLASIFYCDAISVFLRAHLCTAVGCTEPYVRNFSGEREGLSTHEQRKCLTEPLCVASCVTKDLPISPRFSPTIFLSRSKFSTLTSTPLYSCRLYAKNPVFEIVHQESVKVYFHTLLL